MEEQFVDCSFRVYVRVWLAKKCKQLDERESIARIQRMRKGQREEWIWRNLILRMGVSNSKRRFFRKYNVRVYSKTFLEHIK